MAFARAASTCERLPATPMPPSIDVAQPQGVGPAQISAGTSFRMIHMGLGKSISTALQLQDGRTLLPLSFMQVFVKTLTGKTPIFLFEASDTIDNVKDSFLSTTHMLLRLRGGIQIYMKTSADRTITADVELLYLLLSLREGMRIFVKTLTNKTITIDNQVVEGRTLSDYSSVQKEYIRFLLFNLHGGMQIFVTTMTDETIILDIGLVDGSTLSDFSIPKEPIVHLLPSLHGGMQTFSKTVSLPPSLREGMQVFVKTMTDNESTLYVGTSIAMRIPAVQAEDVIDNVKATVQDMKDIPSFQQYMILADKQFEASRNFSAIDIQQEPTMHSLPSLRGGIQIFGKTMPGKTIPVNINDKGPRIPDQL